MAGAYLSFGHKNNNQRKKGNEAAVTQTTALHKHLLRCMQANEPPDSSIQCFTDRLLFGGYIPVAGEADREFLVANTAALFVFPLTAYSLYEFFAKGKRANATILRLLLTLCILLYYLWDFAVHSNGGIDVVILCPLLLFLLMGLFIGSLVGKRKEPGK